MERHLLLYIPLMLIAGGCATKPAVNDRPKTAFTHNTVALMSVRTAEEAETLRQSLLQGKPLPPNAEIIPIQQLDQISPVLSKTAVEMRDCDVSRSIPPTETSIGNAYIILQKGSATGKSCRTVSPDSQSSYDETDEMAGAVLIGILSVGITALLIALPFIL